MAGITASVSQTPWRRMNTQINNAERRFFVFQCLITGPVMWRCVKPPYRSSEKKHEQDKTTNGPFGRVLHTGDDFHVQRWLSCHVFRRLFTISRKPSSLSARCFASPAESRLRGHHLCRAGAVAVTFDPKVVHSAYSNVDAGEAAVSSGRSM